MSEKTNYRECTVDEWNLSIEDGLEFRRKYGREAHWAKAEALFYHMDETQDSNVGPNIIASTGDSLLSALLVQNPQYKLRPLRMDTIDSTPVLEANLNILRYALGMKETMEAACLHTYLYGRGILKLGYDSEFGYEPQFDIGQAAKQVLGISLTQFDKKGQKIEFNDVTPGMPWVSAVLPHDFVVPYGTGGMLTTAPWAAHRIVRHIDDIKADPKYENKKDLVPQMSMADYVKSYLTVMKPFRASRATTQLYRDNADKAEFVEMWEIHDLRTGRVYVVSQGYDKFLRNEIDYLQEDGLPFVSMSFVPSSRTFWTTPDTVYLEASQNEAIDIATMQKKQRRMSTLRFTYKEGAIDLDELEKFMSGEIGIGIKVKETASDNPVVALTPPNSNNQLQVEAEAIRRDSRETVGFSRNQQGEYEAAGRRTATEANVVNEKSEQRLDRRQDKVATAYVELGRKLSKIIFKFWRTPRLIEIIGPDGAAQWTTFTGSDLKGEYQFAVEFNNEPSKTIETRKSDAVNVFTFLANDPSIDQVALRKYLSRAWNDPEFTALFKPGVVSNANLQLSMQAMQAGVGGAQSVQPTSGGGSNPVSQAPPGQKGLPQSGGGPQVGQREAV